MIYHVTYFYLATGMEGVADVEDYGIWEADSPEEAVEKAAWDEYPEGKDKMYGPDNKYSTRDWVLGCLSAKEIKYEQGQAPHY